MFFQSMYTWDILHIAIHLSGQGRRYTHIKARRYKIQWKIAGHYVKSLVIMLNRWSLCKITGHYVKSLVIM